MRSFGGCYTAIVTPFQADGAIDFGALDALCEELIAAGTAGVVPCGTTGESPTLTHEEHRAVVRRVVERVAGRAPVIAGAGSNSTAEAVALTLHAKEVGADATLQVCPYYNKPSQEGLYEHFAAIARASDLPVVLYNIPGRTGISLDPSTVARLAELDTICAIKEATGSMEQTSAILDRCEIDVLSGDDSLTLPLMALGAKGVISVTGNVLPGEMQALCDRMAAGDVDGARQVHRRLYPLFKALFSEPNPVPVKMARHLLGRSGPTVRAPLAPCTDPGRERIRAVLTRLGLLEPVGAAAG